MNIVKIRVVSRTAICAVCYTLRLPPLTNIYPYSQKREVIMMKIEPMLNSCGDAIGMHIHTFTLQK